MIKAICAASYTVVAALLTMPGCWKADNGKPDKGSALEVAKHPLVGKRAPEIVGETLDGASLKLSDQRGKVVLLSFWHFG